MIQLYFVNKKIFTILILSCFVKLYGQITFEKGYFIDKHNVKTECLIKNIDWKNNPVKIEYKINDSTEIQKADTTSIKEFGIIDFSRYILVNVLIDRSSTDIMNLSKKRNPEWSEEKLFLKELVCGQAGLYVYTDNDRTWYFYNLNNSEPEQLIFKDYSLNGQVCTNFSFRQQILNEIQNMNTKMTNINQLKYTETDLTNYFKTYNLSGNYCSQTEFIRKTRDVFNFKIIVGVDNAGIDFANSVTSYHNVIFDNKTYFSCGAEFEAFLPFNKNSWSIFLDPSYQLINTSKPAHDQKTTIKLQTIDIPIGLRWFPIQNQHIKYFVDGFFNPSINIGSEIWFFDSSSLKLSPTSNFGAGIGFSYKTLSAELRYQLNKVLLPGYLYWHTDYQKMSLIVSYRFYNKKGK